MTFTEAAEAVLRMEGKPTTYRKIAETAVRYDMLTHVGNAPAETMQARLADLARRQGEACIFVETRAGTFALREWKGASPGPDTALAARLRKERDARRGAAAAREGPAAAQARADRRTTAGAGDRPREGRRRSKSTKAGSDEAGGRTREEAAKMAAESKEVSGSAASFRGSPGGGEVRSAEQPPGPIETMGTAPAAAAGTQAAAPEKAGGQESAARRDDGRKRRRRKRGKKAGAGGEAAEQAAEARSAPPAAVAVSAEAILDVLLRGPKGRRALRPEDIAAEIGGGRSGDGNLLPAVRAAIGLADAGRRVGGTLQCLSGDRWGPLEMTAGEEVAACERRMDAAVAQQAAAVRRALSRRLMEIPIEAFHQVVEALLAAEGFREIAPLGDRQDPSQPGGGRAPDPLLLRARAPFGPAEIAAVVLVVRARPGRLVASEHLALLRGRLPAVGACQGVIVTMGRVGESMYRDLAPPNAVPLWSIEHDDLLARLIRHGIGVRIRAVEVPLPDPDAFGPAPFGGSS